MRYNYFFYMFSMIALLGELLHSSDKVVDLDEEKTGAYRFTVEIPDSDSRFRMEIIGKRGEGMAAVFRPANLEDTLTVHLLHRSMSDADWTQTGSENLVFWPKEGTRAALGVNGVKPSSYTTRPLHGLLRYDAENIHIWFEGRMILTFSREQFDPTKLSFQMNGKAKLLETQLEPIENEKRFVPVEISHLIKPLKLVTRSLVDGIPFDFSEDKKEVFSLELAEWPEASSDPGHVTETYDGGTYFLSDPRLPLAQIPKADYLAAYVLARVNDQADSGNILTLRLGRRHMGARRDSQVIMFDYPVKVPREGGRFHMVKIPLKAALSQIVEGNIMDMEITKEIRLARRSPDPNRFRWRPLGIPSGVEIAAVTLELSPLQLEIASNESGSLFEEETAPRYSIRLKNITSDDLSFTLFFLIEGETISSLTGKVPAGDFVDEFLTLPQMPPGHYPFTVEVYGNDLENCLLTHEAAFGVLPKDQRKHRETAPWGTWAFSGEHFTPTDNDLIGSIMHKLGLRYGMFSAPYLDRKKYNVIKGNHFKIGANEKSPENSADQYEQLKEQHPDLLPEILIFHEDSISGPHATRIPDIFHDRPDYQLSQSEKERFEQMWEIARISAETMREKYPNAKIHIGNGPIPLREELFRNNFPAELFDTAGNENPTFGRIPESQPPDPIGNNSSLWMDRRLLDAYGYEDKEVSQAHETIYPSTNPGNLSYKTQADYFIRHILHSMAWKMPRIRPGGITDSGNSYYHSNWGGTGLMTRRPNVFPKPAAIAIGVFTLVFDGARYENFIDTGSESAYLMHFESPKQNVYPFWVVRGERDFHFTISGTDSVKVIEQFGTAEIINLSDGKLTALASSSPRYLILPENAKVDEIQLGKPVHPNSIPDGKRTTIDILNSLESWNLIPEINPLLEFYNPMTPRRKGDFTFDDTPPEEEGIKIFPNPIKNGVETMPMYAELVHENGLVLPGRPTEIGLEVNGNSSWSRIIFELQDASGQRWTSIGARARGGSEWLVDWLGKELAESYEPGEIADWNTDDAWGLSRINFDGWRYVGMPLPGQYPGEKYGWAANSQWRSDKDGIVHYPLTLKKLIVEIPEKVLHLTRYASAKQNKIIIKNLMVIEGNVNDPKDQPGDYVERVQITVD